MAKFMYVCEACEIDNSECCCYSDAEDLRKLEDGTQICMHCFDEPETWGENSPEAVCIGKPDVAWKDLRPINLVTLSN